MGAIVDALMELAPVGDGELMEGYQRYEAALASLLTEAQLRTYADVIRHDGEIRVFDEMTPDELASMSADMAAIAATVLGDIDTTMENRRVAALLNQRGQHEVAPDLHQPNLGAAGETD
jgi:hypothetical protein